ncbi:hypothetical protein B0A50_04592 [Salinomyces thailandicus]|uniref:Uncharacterized protein n=1 Tax=Salinomyces thailandicus TaxID=706561 RepID=A0A4U0TVR8_9PEZI|nr:hypothetical protein B0A50_04592 [Salinomyces thailandica]
MRTFALTSALTLLATFATASPIPSPVDTALVPRQSTFATTDDALLTAGSAAGAASGNSTSASTSECGLLVCTTGATSASDGDTSSSSSSAGVINIDECPEKRDEDDAEVAERYMTRVYGRDWHERLTR